MYTSFYPDKNITYPRNNSLDDVDKTKFVLFNPTLKRRKV